MRRWVRKSSILYKSTFLQILWPYTRVPILIPNPTFFPAAHLPTPLLGWLWIEKRREIDRIYLFNTVILPLVSLVRPSQKTIDMYTEHYTSFHTRTNIYKFSFVPRTPHCYKLECYSVARCGHCWHRGQTVPPYFCNHCIRPLTDAMQFKSILLHVREITYLNKSEANLLLPIAPRHYVVWKLKINSLRLKLICLWYIKG